MDIRKRNWPLIASVVLLGLALAVPLAIFFSPSPSSGSGLVSVSLVSVTNDAAGRSVAVFSATNGTRRLFVRGRSQIEVQGNASNEVTTVQLKSVDFLKPRQSVIFSVPFPGAGRAWRIHFSYMGQLSSRERLKEGIGWYLYNGGVPISEKRLRLTPVRDVTTRWIKG